MKDIDTDPSELPPEVERRHSRDATLRLWLALLGLVVGGIAIVLLLIPVLTRSSHP